MGFGSSYRTRSRRLAFILLIIFGAAVIIFGLLVLGIGLAITHNDTFSETLGLREHIESTVDYVQYWIGLPYILAGLSVACSAVNLRKVALTVCTIVVSLLCVVLSLAGLVVDGPDFVWWKDLRATQKYWEGQDGYACSSNGDHCECKNGTDKESITSITDCETLMTLSCLYGVLVGSFIIVLVILMAGVFMIVYIVTSNREKSKRGGTTYFHTTGDVRDVRQSDIIFENPVSEVTNPTHGDIGYEYPVGPAPVSEPPRKPPPKPVPYKDYKSGDSVSQQNNDDVSTIVENDGIVMMDPGRFRLGDDDIY